MTPSMLLGRIKAPAGSALATAGLIAGLLWVQNARGGWPFGTASVGHSTPGAAALPATATGSGVHDRTAVDAASVESLGIRLEAARLERVAEPFRAVAIVVPDEARVSHVHTRVAGWVEQLDVNTTGAAVRAGQPLARIFSQELLSSQTEYLAARRDTAAFGVTSAVVSSGRTRLTVLGMTPAEIDAIEQSGEPRRLVTVVAPQRGVVVNRGVTVGTSVDPSTTLLTIADLSQVWILAEVPEGGISAVRPGSTAQLDFAGSGRAPFPARVDFVYPTLSERTRTLRVRFSVRNPGGTLRPGLYGSATFSSAGRSAITVPRDALVDTGLRQHVFVAVDDRLEPRVVTPGTWLTDRVEILDGLRAGERVVAAGVFLLDSESRLRASGGTGHAHGASAASGASPPDTPHAGRQTASSSDPGGGRPSPPTPAEHADPHAGHRE